MLAQSVLVVEGSRSEVLLPLTRVLNSSKKSSLTSITLERPIKKNLRLSQESRKQLLQEWMLLLFSTELSLELSRNPSKKTKVKSNLAEDPLSASKLRKHLQPKEVPSMFSSRKCSS